MGVAVVDGGILTGGDALYFGVAGEMVDFTIYGVVPLRQTTVGKLRSVADFELDIDRPRSGERRTESGEGTMFPNVGGEVVKTQKVYFLAVLCLGGIALRDIKNIFVNVLLDDKPRATTEKQAFTLAYSVVPVTFVGAKHLARLELHNLALLLAQITSQEVVVVDFAKEADALWGTLPLQSADR